MTLIEKIVIAIIVVVVALSIAAFVSDMAWRKDNFCSAYGPPVTSTHYQKIGDVMVPITSTTTPCIEWRDKETERVTYK